VVIGTDLKGNTVSIAVKDVLGGKNTAVIADPRQGKSYTVGVMLEQLVKMGIHFVVLDPEGEFYSITELGKEMAVPMMVVGVKTSQNCHLTVDVEHARTIARMAVEKGIPVILDLSSTELNEVEEASFLNEFLDEYINIQKTVRRPSLLVIEEADERIPEKGHKKRASDYYRYIQVVKKGGKRGIGSIVVTHRPTWVSKDVWAKVTNWIVGKQTYPPDIQRIEEHARLLPETVKEIPNLDVGQVIIFGDFTSRTPFLTSVAKRECTHVAYTPEVSRPKIIERPDITALATDLQKRLKKVTRKREKELSLVTKLKNQIADLKKELTLRTKENERLRAALDVASKLKLEIASISSGEPVPRDVSERLVEMSKRLDEMEHRFMVVPTENTMPTKVPAPLPSAPWIKKRESTVGAVRELLSHPYCHAKGGLTAGEIKGILKEQAILHSENTLSWFLNHGTKKGEIKRKRVGNRYKYWIEKD